MDQSRSNLQSQHQFSNSQHGMAAKIDANLLQNLEIIYVEGVSHKTAYNVWLCMFSTRTFTMFGFVFNKVRQIRDQSGVCFNCQTFLSKCFIISAMQEGTSNLHASHYVHEPNVTFNFNGHFIHLM